MSDSVFAFERGERERKRERVLDAYVNQQYGVGKILPSLRVTWPTISL